MNEYDEVAEQLKVLEKGLNDSDERIALEERVCIRIMHLPENHSLVRMYHAITGTRTDAGFNPDYL